MELRQPKALCIQDDHESGVRDIDADCNDCGCHKDIEFPLSKRLHGLVPLLPTHATVDHSDPKPPKLLLLKFLKDFFRCRCPQRRIVIGFDQWTDDVQLTPGFQLLDKKIECFSTSSRSQDLAG